VEDQSVAAVVAELYEAYFDGDTEGMLATMADDVSVRFLGRPQVDGIDQARDFFTGNNAALQDLDFRIRTRVIDGEWAAVTWDESATALGRPYENQGVDVFRVVDGKIKVLRVNNDIVVRRRAFQEPGAQSPEPGQEES
jgi:ketosteroid isomerase-like protein